MSEQKWPRRFLELAALVATWSKDTTQVGCVARSADRVVLGTGYNGLPRGVDDRPERMIREGGVKYLWTAHAEENLVAQAARTGASLEGSTVSVTHFPCSRCARSLINAGVARVEVAGDGVTSMPAEEFETARVMFEEAGLEVLIYP